MASEDKHIGYLVVTGPTATGKTRRAVELARKFDGEIISADSRQVFRGMDIGSGKDFCEYDDVRYHLIDIRPAGYKYNLYEFLKDEREARTEIISREKLPILCGGTGLYVESILRGTSLPDVPPDESLRRELSLLSMEQLASRLSKMKRLHNITDLDTKQRTIRAIEIEQYYADHPELAEAARNPRPIDNALVIGIDVPRDIRRNRITQRLHSRLKEGMVDEVRGLIDQGVEAASLINYGLEYRFVTQYILGEMQYNDMIEKLEIAIHQFAKRQMTWFRGMERRGFKIHWMPYDMPDDEFCSAVSQLFQT